MRNYIKLGIFIGFAVLLVACQASTSGEPVQTESGEEMTTQATATTAENNADSDSYPSTGRARLPSATPQVYPEPENGEQPAYEVEFVAPEPGDDTGVVIGQVIDRDTGEPVAFTSIYLGFKILMTPEGFTYAYQEKSSPHTVTNHEGKFGIADVPPGSYLVMITTPHGMSLLMEPNSDQEFEVRVEAGQTVDIGSHQGLLPKP
jgi:hypothetical protein